MHAPGPIGAPIGPHTIGKIIICSIVTGIRLLTSSRVWPRQWQVPTVQPQHGNDLVGRRKRKAN